MREREEEKKEGCRVGVRKFSRRGSADKITTCESENEEASAD